MKKSLFILAILVFAVTLASAQGKSKQAEVTKVVWKGKIYGKGDRVKVISYAGTMKPDETGYDLEVLANEDKTGTILRGMKRKATSYFKPDPNEPVQTVLVRWDAQKWSTEDGQEVELKSFESTIHVEYLEVTEKATTKSKMPVKTKSGSRKKN